MSGIEKLCNPGLFDKLQGATTRSLASQVSKLSSVPITQKEVLLETLTQKYNSGNTQFITAFAEMIEAIQKGTGLSKAAEKLKGMLPDSAAITETKLGTAVMAEGWKKPIVFPNNNLLGWVDKPSQVTTQELWSSAYKVQPSLIFGAVGNSNIKPEQVQGGCSMTKQELSGLYEKTLKEFYDPIMGYLKEQGAKSEDIGFAFAHSNCGVDLAARNVAEAHSLKGLAVTPTTYTKYIRGKEMPPSEEFPNGYILADFPFPSVLTRGLTEINDYAHVYGKMVGQNNPLGIFGGGEHAFNRDIINALTKNGSIVIPADIMKDRHGIVINATNEQGQVTNAAQKMLQDINGNPYEESMGIFKRILPGSAIKEDLRQYEPQAAMTAEAYAALWKAGKVGEKFNAKA